MDFETSETEKWIAAKPWEAPPLCFLVWVCLNLGGREIPHCLPTCAQENRCWQDPAGGGKGNWTNDLYQETGREPPGACLCKNGRIFFFPWLSVSGCLVWVMLQPLCPWALADRVEYLWFEFEGEPEMGWGIPSASQCQSQSSRHFTASTEVQISFPPSHNYAVPSIKGVVGRWIGETAGGDTEWKGKRSRDGWGRHGEAILSRQKNQVEGKLSWRWAGSMTFWKEKEAWMIRAASQGRSQSID